MNSLSYLNALVMLVLAMPLLTTLGCYKTRTMLFLGDSITEEEYYVTEIAQSLARQSSDQRPRVIARGRSAETISGLSELSLSSARPCLFDRLERELWRRRPEWVVVCYGMNCGLFQPFDESRFNAFKNGMRKLVQRMRSEGVRLIILTPPPYARAGPGLAGISDANAREAFLERANESAIDELSRNPSAYGYRNEYPYYDRVMEVYSDWLMTLNTGDGVWVVDIRSAIIPEMSSCFDGDSIHPNQYGHHIMAATFLVAWPRILREAGLL